MNDLTPIVDRVVHVSEAIGTLGAVIRAHGRGSPIGLQPASTVDAARRHLAALDRVAFPADVRLMLAWLRKLAPMVVNAPTDPAEIQRLAEACWDVCQDFPAGVWTDETRRSYVTGPQGKFWPVAKELHDHLLPEASRIAAERRGCKAIIDGETAAAESYTRPPLAERERILENVRRQRAELAAETREFTAPAPTKPGHLSDPVLILSWQREHARGNPSAAVRLRALGVEVTS